MLSVADYWQRAGVAVTTVPIPPQRLADNAYRSTRRGFEVARITADPRALTFFRITNVPRAENNWRGPPGPNYMNQEFDDLVGKYFATIPQRERTEVLAQILHHYTDQLVILPLFYDTQPAAVDARVINVTGRVGANVITWDAAQWDVR